MDTDLTRALKELESRNYEKAQCLLEVLLSKGGNDEDKAYYMMHLFTCLTNLGRVKEAFDLLGRALRIAPSRSRFPLHAGIARATWEIEQGMFKVALERLTTLQHEFGDLLLEPDEQDSAEVLQSNIHKLLLLVS